MEPNKLDLNWREYFFSCDDLCSKIEDEGFTDIIGIARGGLIPAQYIAYKLNIPRVHSFGISSYKDQERSDNIIYQTTTMTFNKDHKILIVDDIADTGHTIKACLDLIKLNNCIKDNEPVIKTATLQYKSKSIIEPDFYGESVHEDIWVVYPYDKK